jgi:hypothetical protein
MMSLQSCLIHTVMVAAATIKVEPITPIKDLQQKTATRQRKSQLENIIQALTRQRTSGAYTSMTRSVSSVRNMGSVSQSNIRMGPAELDSHADTCGFNNIVKVLEYTNQVAVVTGFANSLEPLKNIPIVKASLAYDDAETGETIVIIINQALYFGDQMDEILLKPNQIRAFGNVVDDVPKIFGDNSHSIKILNENFSIPLKLCSIISYFPVRTPTLQEIENCYTITLTSEDECNPYAEDYGKNKS